ncbi:hypothetical protein CLAIMM_03335 [Cladophialophora immunda]|nr:hypothetical protein CLAIMM_03335 [Cladophialophora immunda]
MDPRGVSIAGAAPVSSEAPTSTAFAQGDAVDEEFAFLRVLLEAELNGTALPDFSFTGLLEGDAVNNTPGFAVTDNFMNGLAPLGNNTPGFAATDNISHDFAPTDNFMNGLAPLGNNTPGFAATNNISHEFFPTGNFINNLAPLDNNTHGFASTGNFMNDMAPLDNNTGGFAATGTNYPPPGLDSFFDLEAASHPVGTGVTDDMALNGVGSQFDAPKDMHPGTVNAKVWQNDPSVFPPGFESASNVASSTPIRFNPYAVEGLKSASNGPPYKVPPYNPIRFNPYVVEEFEPASNGEASSIPIRFNPYAVEGLEGELPDLDALTREFVRGAAVDLPNLGASDTVTEPVQNSSLSAQTKSVTRRRKTPEYKFIDVMPCDAAAAQVNSKMSKDTHGHLSSGLHTPTNMPCAVNVGGVDPPATSELAVHAIPAGVAVKDDEDKAEKPNTRKRKADDANNDTDTGSGNANKEPENPQKKNKNGKGYGPRIDVSQPAMVSAMGPFIRHNGERTRDRGVLQQTNQDPNAPKWTRRMPSLLDCTDPYMCPGRNLNCFHAFQNTTGYFLHVENVHGFSRSMMNKPEFKHIKATFEPHPESWWIARGQDTEYQGTDRKQINARRRMKAGMRSNDPNYVEEVYVRTPAARSAANAAANPVGNKKASKKTAKN